jgi:hypothetical protein
MTFRDFPYLMVLENGLVRIRASYQETTMTEPKHIDTGLDFVMVVKLYGIEII